VRTADSAGNRQAEWWPSRTGEHVCFGDLPAQLLASLRPGMLSGYIWRGETGGQAALFRDDMRIFITARVLTWLLCLRAGVSVSYTYVGEASLLLLYAADASRLPEIFARCHRRMVPGGAYVRTIWLYRTGVNFIALPLSQTGILQLLTFIRSDARICVTKNASLYYHSTSWLHGNLYYPCRSFRRRTLCFPAANTHSPPLWHAARFHLYLALLLHKAERTWPARQRRAFPRGTALSALRTAGKHPRCHLKHTSASTKNRG